MDTYTSSFGNTPQGNAMQSLYGSMASIKGVAPNPTAAAGMQDTMQAANMQANTPNFQQNLQNSQSQQAQLPQMTQNAADEAKMYELFAHDQGLANKYTRPDFQNTPGQTTGGVQGVASTQQPGDVNTFGNVGVPNSAILTPESLNQGFQGFTTPGAVNSAMGIEGGQITSALDLLNKALQYQSGQVSNNVSTGMGNYASIINALSGMGSLLGNIGQQEYQSSQGNKQITTLNGHDVLIDTQSGQILKDYGIHTTSGKTGYDVGSTQEAGSLFENIINQLQSEKGGQATEQDVWNYINQNDSALRAQGINVDTLWKLHKDLATKTGPQGQISGGTVNVAKNTTTKAATTSSKKSNWQRKTDTQSRGLLGTLLGNPKTDYLFNPTTATTIYPNAKGDVHVKDLSTGKTGYVPLNEFDANNYEPIK